jgi:predicted nucleic acid-binding Zn ribbon protein
MTKQWSRQLDQAPEGRRLADAVGAYLRSQGHSEVSLLGGVWRSWDDVVGDDVAAHARPLALRHDVLVVAVDHPSWATQLAFYAASLLGQLEERLGQHVASRIEVTVRGRSDLG